MGVLSGKEGAGMEGAAGGEPFGLRNGQRGVKHEEGLREGKIQVERMGGGH